MSAEVLGFMVFIPFEIYDLQWIPESWNMALGGLVLESPIPYLKGMRILMFQLSGFCFIAFDTRIRCL